MSVNGPRNREFQLPPVAVLCDPDLWTWPGESMQWVKPAALYAATALDVVQAFDTATRRDAALEGARVALITVFEILSSVDVPTEGSDIHPLSAVQAYFRIRTAGLSWTQQALQATRVASLSLGDVRLAPMAGSDVVEMCSGIYQMLIDIFALAEPQSVFTEQAASSGRPPTPAAPVMDLHEMWFRRWILGHHLHALFNVMATVALREAHSAWVTRDTELAAFHLNRATRYVKAFPAARAQALALPSSFYNSVLRPSMAPPMTTAPLSGKMHIEYKRYRTQFDVLLDAMPEGIVELSRVWPSVALARESLIEADLLDSYRHASLVAPLVGAQKSLVQSSRVEGNAVSALIQIHNRRASKFSRFLRYPFSVM